MLSFDKLWPVMVVATFSGCLVLESQPNPPGSGGSAGETTSSASSSGSGGAGGTAGSGGGGTCDHVICDMRPAGCPLTNCSQLAWAHRAGSQEADQKALGVAIDATGNVAIAGTYANNAFSFDDAMNVGVPGPVNPGAFTEGFVAYYNPEGTPLWATTFGVPDLSKQTHREARSVAFDSTGFLIVAGFQRNGDDESTNQLFLRRINPGSNGTPSVVWTKTSLAGEITRTEAVAVATDQTNIYVLGRARQSILMVNCGGTLTQIQAGMFIAKYAADASCIWFRAIHSGAVESSFPVAIAARNAGMNGVWITGMFTSTLDVNPLNALLPLGVATFVIKLDDADGTPTAAYGFKPLSMSDSITPAAIGVTNAGVPILVGNVTGVTDFSSSDLQANQQGAFIAAIDAVDSSKATVRSTVLPGSASPAQGARATGIHIQGNKLYVSGTFSDSITLPPSMEIITNPSNVPFLAVFDDAGPSVLSFDAFEVSGTAEPYASKLVQLAGSPNGITLAGGWLRNLDLSTQDKVVNGSLPGPPMSVNADIFVAKFNPL